MAICTLLIVQAKRGAAVVPEVELSEVAV